MRIRSNFAWPYQVIHFLLATTLWIGSSNACEVFSVRPMHPELAAERERQFGWERQVAYRVANLEQLLPDLSTKEFGICLAYSEINDSMISGFPYCLQRAVPKWLHSCVGENITFVDVIILHSLLTPGALLPPIEEMRIVTKNLQDSRSRQDEALLQHIAPGMREEVQSMRDRFAKLSDQWHMLSGEHDQLDTETTFLYKQVSSHQKLVESLNGVTILLTESDYLSKLAADILLNSTGPMELTDWANALELVKSGLSSEQFSLVNAMQEKLRAANSIAHSLGTSFLDGQTNSHNTRDTFLSSVHQTLSLLAELNVKYEQTKARKYVLRDQLDKLNNRATGLQDEIYYTEKDLRAVEIALLRINNYFRTQ